MKRAITRALLDLACSQHALLAAADVQQLAGDYHAMLSEGYWREVLPGVLGPAATTDTPALLEAAAMLWEPRSVLSHFNAARHNGFWVPDDDQVWVTTEYTGSKRQLDNLHLVRSRQFPESYLRQGLIRWTFPDRTLVDLSMCLTPKQLEASLLSAIRAKATTAADVAACAEPLRTRPGVTELLVITSLWRPERESMLEEQLFADVLLAAPDEEVRRQLVLPGRGQDSGVRLDVALPRLRLAFEADGLFFHSTDEQIAADQARDRRLLCQGWSTMRFREGALDDRAAVRRDVRDVVDRRRADLAA